MAERAFRGARADAARGARGAAVVALVLAEHLGAAAAVLFGPRGLRLILNVATVLLVLSLPFAAASSTLSLTPDVRALPVAAAGSPATDDSGSRARALARGIVAGTRSVTTISAQDVQPVVEYAVQDGNTLEGIAALYRVQVDDLAYANGIEDESARLHVGNTLLVPPGRGALYYVKPGDTVASVAEKFKVDPAAIMTYNRLYFEPEHFATDQLIFVPGAEIPAMKRVEVARAIAPPATGALPARTGRLGWPVNGVITQYFWWGHTGVDVAAPYGTTIVSSDDGVVVATGWVAVGGLRVCVQHSGGLQTCYYHTSAVYVSPGQTVARGQALAAIGMTGVTTGPHVHWEAKLNGVAVNPLAY